MIHPYKIVAQIYAFSEMLLLLLMVKTLKQTYFIALQPNSATGCCKNENAVVGHEHMGN